MVKTDNYNEYYEITELWGNRELTLVQSQVLNLLDSLCQLLPEGARIADLGCGDGIVLNALISKYPLLDGYGIDNSQEALNYLSPVLRKCYSNLATLPFQDDFFDLCFSIDVLEHILPENLTTVVGEINRVCRGAILLVSPFLESDAIRTICPHCGCVFSPYYHVNRFNLEVWESLLSEHLKDRIIRFLPLGDSKPYIPPGLGNMMVASGAFVSHKHQTVCPQCKICFSRPQSSAIPNLSLLLHSYAVRNRNVFGLVSEEMGVLTLPSLKAEKIETLGVYDGIWMVTKEDCFLTPEELVILQVQSVYEINFSDPNVLRTGADLFRKQAYVIDNGELKSSINSFLLWQLNEDNHEKSRNIVKSLRLVFPPEPDKKVVNLELFFTSQTKGILKAVLYAIPPNTSKEIGYIEFTTDKLEKRMAITLYPNDKFITPYGMLVDLIWMPKIIDEYHNSSLELHKVTDSNFPPQFFPIDSIKGTILPFASNPSMKKYQLKISHQTFKKIKRLWHVEKGKIFDLYPRLNIEGKAGEIILDLLLIDNVYHEQIIDSSAQIESNLSLFGNAYSSSSHLYATITEQLSRKSII